MPVAFGSAGDIIAVCLLIKDLVKALDESRGSSAEYEEITRELWVLERALLEVEMLSRTCDTTIELNALCVTARRASDDCRRCILAFLEKVKGYAASFRVGGSGNAVKDVSKKLRWQIAHKDDLTRFRAEINAYSTSISMLLMTASVNLLKLNNKTLNARLTKKESEDQKSRDQQTKLLTEIKDRLEEKSKINSSGDTQAQKATQVRRLKWLEQLSTEVKTLMRKIFHLNVETYNSVIKIESMLTSHLERSLVQEPFILEDAIGRIAPVHMQFISSWQAFDSVLEMRFEKFPGYRKIQRKEFALQDHSTSREIDRSYPWEASFLPGQRVNMSMLFINRESPKTSCPRCGLASGGSQSSDNQCAGCGMWYRRITEILETDENYERPNRLPSMTPVTFGQTSFGESSIGPKPANDVGDPSNAAGSTSTTDTQDNEIKLFKRVRVISWENRVKIPPAASVPTLQFQTRKKTYDRYDFEMTQILGTGKCSRVFLAQSKYNQHFYAIKVLQKSKIVKMKQVQHIIDELPILQEIRHSFISRLYGTFQDPQNLYMITDFASGGELFSLLRKSQRFPNPVAKFYAAEMTSALDYLHSNDIIYRNLAPENILLSEYGHLKFVGFGLAKRVPDITWTLCGTEEYIAPEIVASKGYNKSVDWWSLGILTFEMLCGSTPFWDVSPMKVYENILKGRVKYPPYIDYHAQDLLQRLITPNLSVRLGAQHAGSVDVMNHPWFEEVPWERLAKLDIDPPYVPSMRGGAGDTSHFDKYPDETIEESVTGPDLLGYLFQDF